VEQITLNKTDRQFKYEIASRPGAAHFKRCFSCGTCTASCPVSEIDEAFNPRLIIRNALFGLREELLSSKEIWYCAQCYTCYARCPQDVRFTDILAVLRQMAVEEGHAPVGLVEDMKRVDVLAQRIRHDLADIAYDAKNSGASDDEKNAHIEALRQRVEEAITGLGDGE
jgi:heterodisulfide reductase subunit C